MFGKEKGGLIKCPTFNLGFGNPGGNFERILLIEVVIFEVEGRRDFGGISSYGFGKLKTHFQSRSCIVFVYIRSL